MVHLYFTTPGIYTVHLDSGNSADRKLDHILAQLTILGRQESHIMADVTSVKALVVALNDETNTVANKIDAQAAAIAALQAKIDAGGSVTAQDLQDISDGLTPISDRLKAIGADPVNPIPPAA